VGSAADSLGLAASDLRVKGVGWATHLGLRAPRESVVQSHVSPRAYVVEGFALVMLGWNQLRLSAQDLAYLVVIPGTLTAPQRARHDRRMGAQHTAPGLEPVTTRDCAMP
jgi:hypothetical protein